MGSPTAPKTRKDEREVFSTNSFPVAINERISVGRCKK